MHTLLEIIQKTTEYLHGKGVESPRLNAELLVSHVLKLKRMQLYVQFERLLTEPELAALRPLVKRRTAREPLQYILGEVEWSGLRLKVDKRALIPRPETEYLFELVQARVAADPSRVLDLGTGSGALALAAAVRWPAAEVVALDQQEEALALARENADQLGLAARVRFLRSTWCAALGPDERFALILANPPYLTEAEVQEAQPEVRQHEPLTALVAPDAGLADLHVILDQARRHLDEGGLLALETGIAQHAALRARAGELGWSSVESVRDLPGRDRFLFLKR
ncbi:peptide chain release factor N(5)-glutamine methyltransferase [Nibricoccus sp. IMCC34717]|uniref:peptide chain release factor N(5)-glutamine methyltransferase n=1 Tax=Nibricoccus sp. IMCC34717 TaxID=3034021 RepID=UPI00385019AF